jgi:choline kinase
MLCINGRSLLEWQVDELFKCGIEQVTVVVGYGADQVEKLLAGRYESHKVRIIYNPFFAVADNLVSCWVARTEMNGDFILLNGDTLFETAVLQRLLASPDRPITVVTDRKLTYDADDMKVMLDGDRLVRIDKDIPLNQVDAESVGMISFRGKGPALFRTVIEQALRRPQGLKQWYLSGIDEMARSMPVWTCSIEGLQWVEIDYPADLKEAERLVRNWIQRQDLATGKG